MPIRPNLVTICIFSFTRFDGVFRDGKDHGGSKAFRRGSWRDIPLGKACIGRFGMTLRPCNSGGGVWLRRCVILDLRLGFPFSEALRMTQHTVYIMI
jgi:hypothetical protein